MSQISYTFLRNNHTKQGTISTWTREQPGTTRKEKMMGDYPEHLISTAGGNGDDELDLDAIQARADAATEGPWAVDELGDVEDIPQFDPHRFDVMPQTIARTELRIQDGVFIAHARADVPALLALVREQQARLAAAKAEAWDEGVREGWDESGEGWNAEYPLDAKPHSLKHNPYRPSTTAPEGGAK